jgi:hypothetical protein
MYKKAGKSLSRRGARLSWQANPVKARRKAKRRVKAKGGVKAKGSALTLRGANLYYLSKPKPKARSKPPRRTGTL